MILIGEPLLACDDTGRLKSRIGTVFLRTPGIVTEGPMHILQRNLWIERLNSEREKEGKAALTDQEINEENALSVDLLFDPDEKVIQIRPDPSKMELSFRADEFIQDLGVSKRKIVYLNIDNAQVRNALMKRGEYWRMSQLSSVPDLMILLINNSIVSINNQPIYYYNKNTGTRYLSLEKFKSLKNLNDDDFKNQLAEIAVNTQLKNHHGRYEIDIFPTGCGFTNENFKGLSLQDKSLTVSKLRKKYEKLLADFEKAVPDELKHENLDNLVFRKEIYDTITKSRKSDSTCEVLVNISPEFYKQIQWVPGAYISDTKELIFDKVFDEAKNDPKNKDLDNICDLRAKEFILNYLRQFRNIEYINIGRIDNSLCTSRDNTLQKRSNVYIVHFKSEDKESTSLRIIRFQRWCIYENLENKLEHRDMLGAIMQAVDYTDYIFNRRLACTQLGMNLPKKFVTGRIRETYFGRQTKYHGTRIWVVYFERDYVNGTASDKIPDFYYKNQFFCLELADLLGRAAATNLIVARASKEKGKPMFDDGDEVVQIDEKTKLPCLVTVSDHTGTFRNYKNSCYDSVPAYAEFIMRHARKIRYPQKFIDKFLESFETKFKWTQDEYLNRKRAFDRLFIDFPVDEAGSLAYRWEKILKRLVDADAKELTKRIRAEVEKLRAKDRKNRLAHKR